MTAVAIAFVMIYAEKIRKNPALSPVMNLTGSVLSTDNSTGGQNGGQPRK
jgi:uncharacterized ion transporter superfamily protein YfcC